MKHRISTILTTLNQANGMSAGPERDAFIEARIAELAEIAPPSINGLVSAEGDNVRQFIARGEDFSLTLTVSWDSDDFRIASILK